MLIPSLIIFISVFLLFLPLFIDTSANGVTDDTAISSLRSVQSISAFVASLTTVGLMAINLIIDVCMHIQRDGVMPLSLLQGAFITSDILLLGYLLKAGDIISFWCIWNVRDLVAMYSLLLYLFQYGGEVWQDYPIMTLLALALSATMVCRTYSARVLSLDSTWSVVHLGFLIFTIMVLLFLTLKYFIVISSKAVVDSIDRCCQFYCGILLLMTLGILVLDIVFSDRYNSGITISYLLTNVYGYNLALSLVFIFNTRLKEQELTALTMKALAIKQSFVRYVSHEIRSPLQVISMELSALHDRLLDKHWTMCADIMRYCDDAKVRERLHAVLGSHMEVIMEAKQASQIACDILNSLLEGGVDSMELDFGVYRIKDLVTEANEIFFLFARAAGVSLVCKYADESAESCHVLVDKGKIKQVIGNMISNAIKFSARDTAIHVLISFVTKNEVSDNDSSAISKKTFRIIQKLVSDNDNGFYDKVLRIKVVDVGTGISAENQKKLFKGIVQFNPNRLQKGGGSGIGLLMSYNIMKKHNGDMGVYSAGEGFGSEFWIDFPVHDASKPRDSSALNQDAVSLQTNRSISARLRSKRSPRLIEEGRSSSSYRGLVVDDVPSIRRLMTRLVETNQICKFPEQACDGEEALALIKKSMDDGRPYDLVLMDFLMPKMDGPTASRQSREAGFQGLIFGITGNALTTDIDHFKRCGANDVIIKPMRIAELKTLLEKHKNFRRRKESAATSIKKDLKVPQLATVIQKDTLVKGRKALHILHFWTILLIVCALMAAEVTIFLPYAGDGSVIASSSPEFSSASKSMEALQSLEHIVVVVFAITISLFQFVNTLVNYFSGVKSYGVFSLVLLMSSSLPYNFLVLFYVIPYADIKMFVSVSAYRDYTSAFVLLVYLYVLAPRRFEKWLGLSTIVSDSGKAICRIFSLYNPTHSLPALGFVFCLFFGGLMTAVRLFYRTRVLRRKKTWTATDYATVTFLVVFLLADIAVATAITVLPAARHKILLMSLPGLLGYSMTYQLFCLIVVICDSRLLMFERYVRVSLIEEKRTLVRHVSHEIRTPLNILHMGSCYLQDAVLTEYEGCLGEVSWSLLPPQKQDKMVLTADILFEPDCGIVTKLIRECAFEIEQDRTDLSDLQGACTYAIAVLNDLLNYEKLESKELVLDLSPPDSIRHVMADASESLCSIARKEGFVAEMTFDPNSDVSVIVDSAKIMYAVANVVKYACKIFPSGNEIIIAVGAVASSYEPGCGSVDRLPLNNLMDITRRSISSRRSQIYAALDVASNSSRGRRMTLSAPTHARIQISYRVPFSEQQTIENPLRFDNVFTDTVSGADAFAETVAGNFSSNLGLYVCDELLKLHYGKFEVVYRKMGDSVSLAFNMMLPIVNLVPYVSDVTFDPPSTSPSSGFGVRSSLSNFRDIVRTFRGGISASTREDASRNRRETVSGSSASNKEISSQNQRGTCSTGSSMSNKETNRKSVLICSSRAESSRREMNGDEEVSESPSASCAGSSKAPPLDDATFSGRSQASSSKSLPTKGSVSHRSKLLKLNLHVLCVDDSPTNLKMLCRVVIGHGICDHPHTAEDGEQALVMMQASMDEGHPYDLVLMDYMMPKMDGPTAVKFARGRGFAGLVVGITGNAFDAEIRSFKSHGADEVLLKPIDAHSIIAVIREAGLGL